MLCFKCLKEVHGAVKELLSHLKYVHNINQKICTQITCCQNNCKQTFSYVTSYKRHLLAYHTQDRERNNDDNHSDANEFIQEGSENDLSDNQSENEDFIHDQVADQTVEDINSDIAMFIAKMKAAYVPYLFIQNVIDEAEELVQKIVCYLRNKVLSLVRDIKSGRIPTANRCDEILQHFTEMKDPFKGLKTQSQQDKYFREKGVFVSPEEKVLGRSFVSQTDRETGRVNQVLKDDTYQYVPIDKTIKKHLERPGIMTAILNHQDSGNNEVLETYRDGSYFKTKFHQPNETVIPILLYNDDYESANPLGSRKGSNKISGFYLSLLCLPAQFQAKLVNIILAGCCKSSLVQKYGMDMVLHALVADLKRLEAAGLQISCASFRGIVKPVLFQVIGDNLGLHQMLGFTQGFTANFPCRFCKADRHLVREQFREDPLLLRNEVNFAEDLLMDNVSLTGIKRDSSLNQIPSFHVTRNYAPDIMHDFDEGILPFEIKLTLGALIAEGCFSLDELNNRLSSFSYGFIDRKNRPSPISPSAITNPTGASGQTAAQMNCLVQYLPLIIGDLVPEESDNWEVLLLLFEIYKIIMAPRISKAGTLFLKELIQDHHSLFLDVHIDHHLLPKHHFVIHYPRIINLLGPLIQFSSKRKEGKHKPFKQWAHACNNYQNITKTVATRHQQQQSYVFLSRNPVSAQYEMDIKHQVPIQVSQLDEADNLCRVLGCAQDTIVILAGSVDIQSYVYKPNSTVLYEWNENGPQFAKVDSIIVLNGSVYLVANPWKYIHFNRHMQAHAVVASKDSTLVLKTEDLVTCRPFHASKCHKEQDPNWYIAATFTII